MNSVASSTEVIYCLFGLLWSSPRRVIIDLHPIDFEAVEHRAHKSSLAESPLELDGHFLAGNYSDMASASSLVRQFFFF